MRELTGSTLRSLILSTGPSRIRRIWIGHCLAQHIPGAKQGGDRQCRSPQLLSAPARDLMLPSFPRLYCRLKRAPQLPHCIDFGLPLIECRNDGKAVLRGDTEGMNLGFGRLQVDLRHK